MVVQFCRIFLRVMARRMDRSKNAPAIHTALKNNTIALVKGIGSIDDY
jgi:hypothetical protein